MLVRIHSWEIVQLFFLLIAISSGHLWAIELIAVLPSPIYCFSTVSCSRFAYSYFLRPLTVYWINCCFALSLMILIYNCSCIGFLTAISSGHLQTIEEHNSKIVGFSSPMRYSYDTHASSWGPAPSRYFSWSISLFMHI